MMNPRAGRWVKESFLQTRNVVSVRLVRIAPWVCKLLFKVEMQLKHEDICLSVAAFVLCCGAAALAGVSRTGGSGVWQDPHPERCLHSLFWCLQSCEFQRCGKTFQKSPVMEGLQEGSAGLGPSHPCAWALHQHLPGNPLLRARTP